MKKVEPLEVLLRLESSGKWPDELDAVRSTATAFLIRLAQCLEKQVMTAQRRATGSTRSERSISTT